MIAVGSRVRFKDPAFYGMALANLGPIPSPAQAKQEAGEVIALGGSPTPTQFYHPTELDGSPRKYITVRWQSGVEFVAPLNFFAEV